MALAQNRVTFLEVLLNCGVNLQSFLTQNILQFLYGYVAIVRTNYSPIKYESGDYCDVEENDLVSELCQINESKKRLTLKKSGIKLDVIKKNINKLCNRFMKKGNEIYTEVSLINSELRERSCF